jgi:hypothetical protein
VSGFLSAHIVIFHDFFSLFHFVSLEITHASIVKNCKKLLKCVFSAPDQQ